MTQLVPSIFAGPGRDGDFAWMIKQPRFSDAFFLFNDDEGRFAHHRQNVGTQHTCPRGAGNAVIRPYQCRRPPRAAGIPTGARGRGYSALTPEVERVIDEAVAAAVTGALASGAQRVFYSAADSTGRLGTGIFQVAPEVKEHIVQRLRSAFGDD
ncbi:MAG: hypothetical protein U0904_00390 [Candidatus Nanopelagicales bacterium]|nr:hypothetical protein [Candidatus Nanopelagicales bacterium]